MMRQIGVNKAILIQLVILSTCLPGWLANDLPNHHHNFDDFENFLEDVKHSFEKYLQRAARNGERRGRQLEAFEARAETALETIRKYKPCNIEALSTFIDGRTSIVFNPKCNQPEDRRVIRVRSDKLPFPLRSNSRGLIDIPLNLIKCLTDYLKNLATLNLAVPRVCCDLPFPFSIILMFHCGPSPSPLPSMAPDIPTTAPTSASPNKPTRPPAPERTTGRPTKAYTTRTNEPPIYYDDNEKYDGDE